MYYGNTDSALILGQIPSGSKVQRVFNAGEGWNLVRYDNKIGYVHGNYTQSLLKKAQNEYPFLGLTELKVKKIGYSTATLNFRQGNSTDIEIIGEFSKYETVRILGEYEGWYFVMTNDYHFGFVSKDYTSELTESFVVVDVSKQQLFLYYNNELYYTTPVVTGKDSTPSDIGLFAIQYKCRNAILMNDTPVEYWMKYNNSGEGLHDADWRSQFGTDAYHYAGSHGCINIPPEITDEIYDNTTVGTKVIVHK